MDEKTLLQALGAAVVLVFGLVSACIGALLNHLLMQGREDRDYRIKKLEEVFVKLRKLDSEDIGMAYYLSCYCKAKISKEAFLAKAGESKEYKGGVEADSVYGMCNILFPELCEAVEAWHSTRKKMLLFQFAALKEPDAGSLVQIGEEFDKFAVQYGEVGKELEKEMFRTASEIRKGSWGWLLDKLKA